MPLPDRTTTRFLSRRILLRTAFTFGVVAGTAGALAPIIARGRPANAPRRGVAGPPGLERFAEMYRGRRIEGSATVLVPVRGPRTRPAVAVALPSVEVRIDGRPLHVMRRADGSYLSLVNHYESFPTLREVARAAVDELGAAQLASTPPTGHTTPQTH
ncbi:tyrosinase cofactor [Streptomyces albipurpureus]|uniref:Tyrosinase cofactor n=1 Tax=Streptomyces albipurpureus TaxID=2897419 RepID=A0ABT0ULU0_9ACTN|nr:tyrosinase cofactor [Streptomyces sp. CWNU-1]MCM2389196.1 tyrosinase cofactor [Streptomyces sp. CWNU-1]